MPTVRITRAAVAHPPFRLSQDDAARCIGTLTRDPRRVHAIARGTRIQGRQLVLPPGELIRLGSIAERNAVYREHASTLAYEAARQVVDPAHRSRLAAVLTTSCTGYALPGWGAGLLPALGLSCDAVRLPITEAGCAGGAVALARAADFLRAHPGTAALVASCELCSLAFHPAGSDGNLTSSLIFGDGAGAALLETSDGRGSGLELVDSASLLVPGTASLLGFDLTDTGFYPVLDRRLVRALGPATAAAAARLLARHSLAPTDVRAWLLHPGGARILAALQSALGFERALARWSWDSMGEFGNTSSAAIFDVLRRYLADPQTAPGPVIVAAFGPGVAVELLLLENRC